MQCNKTILLIQDTVKWMQCFLFPIESYQNVKSIFVESQHGWHGNHLLHFAEQQCFRVKRAFYALDITFGQTMMSYLYITKSLSRARGLGLITHEPSKLAEKDINITDSCQSKLCSCGVLSKSDDFWSSYGHLSGKNCKKEPYLWNQWSDLAENLNEAIFLGFIMTLRNATLL